MELKGKFLVVRCLIYYRCVLLLHTPKETRREPRDLRTLPSQARDDRARRPRHGWRCSGIALMRQVDHGSVVGAVPQARLEELNPLAVSAELGPDGLLCAAQLLAAWAGSSTRKSPSSFAGGVAGGWLD